MRFTIWRQGLIIGTYPGKDEAEALDNAAKDEGFASFVDCNAKKSLTRDDYRVKAA